MEKERRGESGFHLEERGWRRAGKKTQEFFERRRTKTSIQAFCVSHQAWYDNSNGRLLSYIFQKKERARVNLVKALSSFCNRVRLWCCRCQLSVALNFNKNNPIRTLLLWNFQKNEARQKKSFCLTLNSIWLNSGSRPKTLFNFLKKIDVEVGLLLFRNFPPSKNAKSSSSKMFYPNEVTGLGHFSL